MKQQSRMCLIQGPLLNFRVGQLCYLISSKEKKEKGKKDLVDFPVQELLELWAKHVKYHG